MVDRTLTPTIASPADRKLSGISRSAREFATLFCLAVSMWTGPAVVAGALCSVWGVHAQAAMVLGIASLLFHTFVPWGKWCARLGLSLNPLFAGLVGMTTWAVCWGAGTAVATVRWKTEEVIRQTNGMLVRINPRDYMVPIGPHLALPLGAAEGVNAIYTSLRELLFGVNYIDRLTTITSTVGQG